jgi:hypothetical protein
MEQFYKLSLEIAKTVSNRLLYDSKTICMIDYTVRASLETHFTK